MEADEKNLSHLESLGVIADAINRTKENYRENSFYFLLWGWLIAIASFSFFALQQLTTFEFYFLPFLVAAAIGITVTILRYAKDRSTVTTESYLTYFLSRLWLVLGITFLLVVFINVSRNNPPFTYTLIIAGIGTLVSGLVMKFNPMKWGGILFFIASVISIYIPEPYIVLLHGCTIIAGYLIPGYLLKRADQ